MSDLHAHIRGYRCKGGGAVITVQRPRQDSDMTIRERRYRVTGRRFVAVRHWIAGLAQCWSGSLLRSSFRATLRGAWR